MTQLHIPYTPTPRQCLLHEATEFEVLYGGAAGGGKTESLLWEGYLTCLEIPNIVVAFFRRTYPELHDSAIRRSLQKFPQGIGEYRVADKEWRFPNGSALIFRHCEKEEDVYKYQSAEFVLLLIDELTHFTEYQYQYLKSRVRTSQPGLKNRLGVRSATNPGNVGHGWVKEYFIDPAPPMESFNHTIDTVIPGIIMPDMGRELSCKFIPAKIADNPYLVENDPMYVIRLLSLPETERRALLAGDWDVFEGQVFKEFRRDIHVCPPFSPPRSWRRYAGLDYGYQQPYCFLLAALDPETNKLYVYRELYASGVAAHQQAKAIKDILADNGAIIFADPSMWARRDEKSHADIYAENGVQLQPANRDRLVGWSRIHERLELDDSDEPQLYITSNCLNLIRTLPKMIYDKHRVEDVDTTGEDHAPDALRYLGMGVPRQARHEYESFEY